MRFGVPDFRCGIERERISFLTSTRIHYMTIWRHDDMILRFPFPNAFRADTVGNPVEFMEHYEALNWASKEHCNTILDLISRWGASVAESTVCHIFSNKNYEQWNNEELRIHLVSDHWPFHLQRCKLDFPIVAGASLACDDAAWKSQPNISRPI